MVSSLNGCSNVIVRPIAFRYFFWCSRLESSCSLKHTTGGAVSSPTNHKVLLSPLKVNSIPCGFLYSAYWKYPDYIKTAGGNWEVKRLQTIVHFMEKNYICVDKNGCAMCRRKCLHEWIGDQNTYISGPENLNWLGLQFPPFSAMSCHCCRGEIEGLTWGWSLPAWP